MQLTLKILPETFAICRFNNSASIPNWVYKEGFYSITRTKDELSIVCIQDNVDEKVDKVERDWRVLKVVGPLDFSLVGIIANLSSVLANGGVSIFVISTFDTDYILVKEKNLEKAREVLYQAGHKVS